MHELDRQPCEWLQKEFKSVREQRNQSRHERLMTNLRRYGAAVNGTAREAVPVRRGRGPTQRHSLYVIGDNGANLQLAMVLDRCAGRVTSSDLRRIWDLALGKLNRVANEYGERRGELGQKACQRRGLG